jgi:hypothetical protein
MLYRSTSNAKPHDNGANLVVSAQPLRPSWPNYTNASLCQPERGHNGCALGHVACTLYRWGEQGVSATKEHPRHHRHAAGGEFLTTLGRGLHIDPQWFQG